MIRYRNAAGALVTVFEIDRLIDPSDPNLPDDPAAAQCGGCREVMATDAYTRLRDAREWAADHARTCAALPGLVAGAADPETFGVLAEQYAQHAARLLEGRAPEDGAGGPHETTDPADVARIYVGIADVYARLVQGRPHLVSPAARNEDGSPRRMF